MVNKAVRKLGSLESRVSDHTDVPPKPRIRIPKLPLWAYAVTGVAAAATIYLSTAAAGVFPNPLAGTPQPKPVPTVPAGRATPTADRLATIRHYQPELANLIEQQPWFKDGVNQREQVTLYNLERRISSSRVSYLQDKFVLDGSEKVIVMTYDSELADAAKEASRYLKEFIPKSQVFFGIPIRWSLIYVNLTKIKEGETRFSGGASEGGIANIVIKKSEQDLNSLNPFPIRYTIGHEGAGHLVVDQDSKGGPLWYSETLADAGYLISSKGNEGIDNELRVREEEKNLRSKKPLAEYTLEDHLKQGEHISKGMHLLLSWRKLVEQQNFQAFVNSNDAIAKARGLTNEDIRENMLKFTPGSYKAGVGAMYDAAVFGK